MFVVRIAENSSYLDQSGAYAYGEFSTWEEALTAARAVVDRCLAESHRPGMTAETLFMHYTTFGDDVFIVPVPAGESFSGWDYARERCAALCA